MKSLIYCCIWYKIISRPHEVTFILLHLIQNLFQGHMKSLLYCCIWYKIYFKATWIHSYTAASATTLIQGHMKSLLYCCIRYNINSRPHEISSTLLNLQVQMFIRLFTNIRSKILETSCLLYYIMGWVGERGGRGCIWTATCLGEAFHCLKSYVYFNLVDW